VRCLALLFLLALIGCSSDIPSRVQPQEYAVYHAFLVDYLARHPPVADHLYTFNEVDGSAFFTGERQSRRPGPGSHCVPQQADDAFWKVNNKRYSLDSENQQWRTLRDGKAISVLTSAMQWPTVHTAIGFSRVFFNRDGRNAYFRANVGYCTLVNPPSPVAGCGGYSFIWHAIRAGDGWQFYPTACRAES